MFVSLMTDKDWKISQGINWHNIHDDSRENRSFSVYGIDAFNLHKSDWQWQTDRHKQLASSTQKIDPNGSYTFKVFLMNHTLGSLIE
jgi:hypothetical protein